MLQRLGTVYSVDDGYVLSTLCSVPLQLQFQCKHAVLMQMQHRAAPRIVYALLQRPPWPRTIVSAATRQLVVLADRSATTLVLQEYSGPGQWAHLPFM